MLFTGTKNRDISEIAFYGIPKNQIFDLKTGLLMVCLVEN